MIRKHSLLTSLFTGLGIWAAVGTRVVQAQPTPELTELVSTNSAEAQANHLSARRGRPVASFDGVLVAFDSLASNLVTGDTNGADDIFLRDRAAGTTERISVNSAGVQGNGQSVRPSITHDGLMVAFESEATNLAGVDTNGESDIFVRDRSSNTTVRASVSSAGVGGNDLSISPTISADGRFVVFASDATNLISDKTTIYRDIYVRDLVSLTTERVNLSDDEAEAAGNSFVASISGDGRYVALSSLATNLVAADFNGQPDIFVRDRLLGTTQRFSIDSAGAQSNHASTDPGISGNGLTVPFFSLATNLVAEDTNVCSIPPLLIFDDPGECPDIFAHDSPLTPEPPGACPEGTVAECSDEDGDGIRDDNCRWWQCSAGECQSTPITFADLGGSFGGCLPDGVADANDRFHALNCFSNVDTAGALGYPCEAGPPLAFNVDAGGPFGDCLPDGVCDLNDAFHVLNAFGGTSTCSCPGGGGPATTGRRPAVGSKHVGA